MQKHQNNSFFHGHTYIYIYTTLTFLGKRVIKTKIERQTDRDREKGGRDRDRQTRRQTDRRTETEENTRKEVSSWTLMSHEPHSGLKTNHTFQIIFHQLKIQVTKTPIRSWTTVLDTTQSTAISIRKKERKKLTIWYFNELWCHRKRCQGSRPPHSQMTLTCQCLRRARQARTGSNLLLIVAGSRPDELRRSSYARPARYTATSWGPLCCQRDGPTRACQS